MLDWASIQVMVHSIVKALSGVDTQGIVAEKKDDVDELARLFSLGLEATVILRNALNDGVISQDEWAEFKAKIDVLDDQYKAVIAEIKDWKAEE